MVCFRGVLSGPVRISSTFSPVSAKVMVDVVSLLDVLEKTLSVTPLSCMVLNAGFFGSWASSILLAVKEK